METSNLTPSIGNSCEKRDFTIQTEREIHHRRPGTEKYEKYQDLEREIKRIWKSKVVPVVVGALGSVSKNLAGHLEQLGISAGRLRSRHEI